MLKQRNSVGPYRKRAKRRPRIADRPRNLLRLICTRRQDVHGDVPATSRRRQRTGDFNARTPATAAPQRTPDADCFNPRHKLGSA